MTTYTVGFQKVSAEEFAEYAKKKIAEYQESCKNLAAENFALKNRLKNTQEDNAELFEALKSTCKQLHDTRKAKHK